MPLTLPEGRHGFLYRFDIEASPERIASLVASEGAFRRRAARPRRGASPPTIPSTVLVLLGGLAWRRSRCCAALRNHVLQIRPHYNAETVNGVLLRNIRWPCALFRSFKARFDPKVTDGRAAAMAEAEAGVKKAMTRWAAWPTTRSCAPSTTSSAPRCARTSTSSRRGRCWPSRWTAARSRACPRRARCSRSTSTRGSWRASTCAAARSRAAASAGATATTTSAPKSWAS